MASKGRGRLNAFEKLPSECDQVIAWAADEINARKRDQVEIYPEFCAKLEKLRRDHHGELDFTIPSASAFNRYSIRLATLTRRLEETREIAGAIAEKFDAEASDNLTVIAAEAIKTLVFEILTNEGEGGVDPKGAMQLAAALRAATQAQGVSTIRRSRVEANFEQQVNNAVDQVKATKGLTNETAEAIKAQILGVEAPPITTPKD